MKRYLLVGLLLALMGAGYVATLLLPAPSPSLELQQFNFPEKLQMRLLLPEDQLQEINRQVHYADDKVTKVREDVFFKDGSVGLVTYRPDGERVSSFTVHYPQIAGEPKQIKLAVQYEEDGVSLAWEKHLRQDGTKIRTGHRLPSGTYAVETFFADGSSTSGNFVYQEGGKLARSHELYENGKDKKIVEVVPVKGTFTTNFSEAGLKTSFHWINGGEITWETFQDDGVTPVVRYEQKAVGSQHGTSYHTLATYFNDDGSINHVRKFSRHGMTAYFLDDDKNVVYRQLFSLKKGNEATSLEPDQWKLDSVYNGDDQDYTAESFHFHDDGSIERHVVPDDEDAHITKMHIKVYHLDGSLAEYNRPDPAKPGESLEDKYELGESKERFDVTLLKGRNVLVPYTVPPQMPPKARSHHQR